MLSDGMGVGTLHRNGAFASGSPGAVPAAGRLGPYGEGVANPTGIDAGLHGWPVTTPPNGPSTPGWFGGVPGGLPTGSLHPAMFGMGQFNPTGFADPAFLGIDGRFAGMSALPSGFAPFSLGAPGGAVAGLTRTRGLTPGVGFTGTVPGGFEASGLQALPGFAPTAQRGRWPLINIWDDGGRLRIEAEAPGVSLDDIELQLAGRTLFIRTGRVIERSQEREQLLYGERPSGPFVRSVPLPAEIDLESVEAKLVNGVLELTLTKVGAEQRRTIRVSKVGDPAGA